MRTLLLNTFAGMFALLLLIGCGGQSGDETTTTGEDSTTTEKPEEVAEEPKEPNAVCLWPEAISIREKADPKSKYLTAMYLGEKVFYLGDDQEVEKRTYCKVKLQDGTEGYTRKDFLAVGFPVAVLEDATIYKRPDLLAKTDNKFARMSVIGVISEKEGWLEVKGKNGSWFSEGWIKKDNVTNQEVDVVVAAYYTKAKMIKDEDKKKAEMQALTENDDLAGSIFMNEIREKMSEVEEAPEPDPVEEEPVEEGDM